MSTLRGLARVAQLQFILISLPPVSEIPMAGPFTFHELALIVSAATALLAMFTSFYLIWMHALNYTKPEEQK